MANTDLFVQFNLSVNFAGYSKELGKLYAYLPQSIWEPLLADLRGRSHRGRSIDHTLTLSQDRDLLTALTFSVDNAPTTIYMFRFNDLNTASQKFVALCNAFYGFSSMHRDLARRIVKLEGSIGYPHHPVVHLCT